MSLQILLYDPRNVDKEDFKKSFVARHDLVKKLLRGLKASANETMARHTMLIGQRGMGKTSLLRYLAISIEEDKELNKLFIPLEFREEQYNVSKLNEFWKNCLESLAEWFESNKKISKSEEIDNILNSDPKGEKAFSNFRKYYKNSKKRPVLLVDNVDMILKGIKNEERWALRSILQEPDGPIMICATTETLKMLLDPNEAFYEFFNVQYLNKLTIEELSTCLRTLSKVSGEKGKKVLKIIGSQPERIRILHNLTGGNPRTLVILYKLLENEDSSEVMSDLIYLLDTVTPFYKARIEELTPQQRKVLDAIALNWDPITIKKLFEMTGLEKTSLSPQIKRLKESKFIENVEISKAISGYQIVERFLNIWYLMRSGTRRTRSKLKFFIKFYTSFYSPKQIESMAREQIAKQTNDYLGYCINSLALVESVDGCEIRSKLIKSLLEKSKEDKEILNVLEKFSCLDELRNYSENSEAFTIYDYFAKLPSEDIYSLIQSDYSDNSYAWTIFGQLLVTRKEKNYKEAEKAYRKALEINPENDIALNNLGILLQNHFRKHSEAEVLYRKALEINPKNKYAVSNLGVLLLFFGRHDDAEKVYRESLKADPNNINALNNLGILLLLYQRRYNDAEKLFRKALEINPKSDIALVNLGNLLQIHFGRFDEAEATFRKALEANPDNVLALNNLGNLLSTHLERCEEAEDAYKRALKIDPNNTITLINLGALLTLQLHRYGEAEELFRKALNINPKDDLALVGLGNLFHLHLGRYEEAEELFRKALAINPKLVTALTSLGNLLLDHLGRFNEAKKLYQKGLKLDPENGFLNANLAWLHLITGKVDKAILISNRVIKKVEEIGADLLNAAIQLFQDNFGQMTHHLTNILESNSTKLFENFIDDLYRLLRLVKGRGYGQKLLDWFCEEGYNDQYRPIYEAFNAYVNGEGKLLDVNPEVREPARDIYNWLTSNQQDSQK